MDERRSRRYRKAALLFAGALIGALLAGIAAPASATTVLTLREDCTYPGVQYGVRILVTGAEPNVNVGFSAQSSTLGDLGSFAGGIDENGNSLGDGGFIGSTDPLGFVTIRLFRNADGDTDEEPGEFLAEATIDRPCEGVTPRHPQSKADCKNDSWRHFVDNTGRPFRNEGGCLVYVAVHDICSHLHGQKWVACVPSLQGCVAGTMMERRKLPTGIVTGFAMRRWTCRP